MRFLHTTYRAVGATAACLLLSVTGAMASTVPVAESFEAYTNGHPIASAADWSGTPSDASVVSTNSAAIAALVAYTNGTGNSYPLPEASHAKVLALNDEVRSSVGSETGGVVIAEWLAMPAQRDSAPVGSADHQMAFYVNTSSNVVIWHAAASSNEWLTLSGTSVSSGEWVRVRVVQDYATDRYQLALDGTVVTDAAGETRDGSPNGSWFNMVQTNHYLTRFRTQGDITAYMDDLVFTNRTLSWDGNSFFEAQANDGSIVTTNSLTLVGDTFTNTTYVAGTHFTTSGVPAGLEVALTYAGPTELNVTLTGNADEPHTDADDAGMTLELLDDAFTLGAASSVVGYTNAFTVDFHDGRDLSWPTDTFSESTANDGTIGNAITVTLAADTFVDATYNDGDEYTVAGTVPSGLALAVVYVDANHVTISLDSSADTHDGGGGSFTLTFNSAAFTDGDATSVAGYSTNLTVAFTAQPSVAYTGDTFTEREANDGGTDDEVIITLTGDTWATGIDASNHVSVLGVPAGLVLDLVRDNTTNLTASFSGTATDHDGDPDGSVTLTFLGSAFAGIGNAALVHDSETTFTLDFTPPPNVAAATTTFSERDENDGKITETVTITLTGDTWAGDIDASTHVSVSGVPDGLTFELAHVNTTNLTASFTGTATDHSGTPDGSVTLTFSNSAFVAIGDTNLIENTEMTFAVDFNPQPSLSYSTTTFSESIANNGSVDTVMTITLNPNGTGETFAGSGSENFVAEGWMTVSGEPNGLVVVATRTSDTTLSVTLTGNASPHDELVTGMSFTFEQGAFAKADAAWVTGRIKTGLSVEFNDSELAINLVNSSLSVRESFETYADGTWLGAAQGWTPGGVGQVTADVTMASALTAWGSAFPIDTTHDQVLKITDEIADEIQSDTGGQLYTDCMLYMVGRVDPPEGKTDYQVAFYVNTNEQVVIWHEGTSSNEWLTLTGSSVATSAWHRFTVKQDQSNYRFQLYVDGSTAPLSDAAGYASRTGTTQGGSWFKMVNKSGKLSRMRVLGGAVDTPSYLDDLVVTQSTPDYLISGSLFMFR
jgi:hypothetical protein